jgi:cytochrome c oxidase assembly factor CtaG
VSVPPLVVCFVAASLYALGGRGRRRVWREVSFYAGVASVLVVLEPPFDGWADTSFALHMTQHVVLLTVSAPLLVLGRPWPRLWLAFPLRPRRAVGRALAGSAGFRLVGRTAARPAVAFALMTAALALWHVPALYDAAVRSEGVHVLEHVCFLATALLYWGALLEAPPVRARIGHLHRAGWFFAALVPGWILALVLAYARTPLYGAYASLAHRPGGLSALADQQLAAGVMWVPGSLAYLVAGIVAFYRWLGPAQPPPEPQPEEIAWTSSPRTGSPATS